MGVSVHYLGFGVPLLFILLESYRAFRNRCTSGASIKSGQWKGCILLLLEIGILGVMGFLDLIGDKGFVIGPTPTSSGGVQVMNSFTGQVGLLILGVIFIGSLLIKSINMLPAVLYTWPIFLVLLGIDYEGCSTYVEKYQRSCVIGGASLCDGLMLIILIHGLTLFLISRRRDLVT